MPGLVSAALFRDGAQTAFYQYGGVALMSLALRVLLLVLTSLGNLDFLNRSSLHPFYRARLVRAYLGASTRERMTPGNGGPMQRRVPNPDDLAVPVAEDDIALTDYAPYRSGGPVQLLNVCFKQTQDRNRPLSNCQHPRGSPDGKEDLHQRGRYRPLFDEVTNALNIWTRTIPASP